VRASGGHGGGALLRLHGPSWPRAFGIPEVHQFFGFDGLVLPAEIASRIGMVAPIAL
jgi:hypothetical protein